MSPDGTTQKQDGEIISPQLKQRATLITTDTEPLVYLYLLEIIFISECCVLVVGFGLW